MFKCQLADFNICFEDYLDSLKYRIGQFHKEFETEDIRVSITETDVLNERIIDNGVNKDMSDAFFEEVAAFRNLAEVLPKYNALVMHSCLISVENSGVAFTAPSGTGKTTHMLLWKKTLKDKLTIINGDKPIIRFIDDEIYGYGTPWNGKENLYTNGRVPLKHICKIERSKNNKTVQMSKEDAMVLLLQQVYMPKNPENVAQTMQLITKIVDNVKFWTIYCNMEDNAAEVAQKTIFAEKYDNLLSDTDNIKNEFMIQKSPKILCGKWTPLTDIATFNIKNIPFTPQKILLSCNDVLFSKITDNNAYYVSLNVDLSAKRCLAHGGAISKSGGINFAVNRRSIICDSIKIDGKGVEIDGLILDNLSYYFKADCEYTWIIIG